MLRSAAKSPRGKIMEGRYRSALPVGSPVACELALRAPARHYARVTVTAILIATRTVVAAAWAMTHILILWRVLSNVEIDKRERYFSLLPPLSPWYAWKNGHRALSMLWVLWLMAYSLSWAGSGQ